MPKRIPSDSERFLERYLSGDLDPDDPAVKSRLEGDSVLAEALAELRELEGDMKELACDQRAVIEDARLRTGGPGEDRVSAGVTAFLEEERRAEQRARGGVTKFGSRPRRALLVATALAAAVLAAVILIAGESAPDDAKHLGPVLLGDTENSALSPTGIVDEYSEFSWTLTLPPGGWFVVRIFEAEHSVMDAPLFEEAGLEAQTTSLDLATARELPDSVEWLVDA